MECEIKPLSWARAVALKYREGVDPAPLIAAVGERQCARLMAAVARRYGVPLVSGRKLVDRLSQIPVFDEIPAELYEEVALIFSNIPKPDEPEPRRGLRSSRRAKVRLC